MKHKLLSLITLVGILAAVMAAPLTAYAQDDDYDLVVGDPERTASSISMTAGSAKDLTDYMKNRVWDEDAVDRWYLVGSVKWTSLNTAVVTVDQNGLATAHKAGTAVVTANGYDNTGRNQVQSFIIGVKTGNGAASTTTSITITEGMKINLSALPALNPKGGSVRWSSASEYLVVDDKGGLTADGIAKGIVTATVTGSDGTETVHRIEVEAISMLLSHQIRDCAITLDKGQEVDIIGWLYPGFEGSTVAKSMISADSNNVPAVGTGGGVIAANNSGKAIVSVYKQDGNDQNQQYRISVTVR